MKKNPVWSILVMVTGILIILAGIWMPFWILDRFTVGDSFQIPYLITIFILVITGIAGGYIIATLPIALKWWEAE